MTTLQIRMFDYRRELAHIRGEVLSAVEKVLDSGALILGPEVEAFEQEMAESLGGGHAVGVASGTDALIVALLSRGVRAGDEVITVANTAVATANAIQRVGAVPVFCDIDPRTGLMDIGKVSALLSARTRAVIPVHLYGNAVDVPALLAQPGVSELFVLEDCAQAQAATLRGQRIGSFGHAAAFSFYPTKNLGAYGDGGLCFTHELALRDVMRQVRRYGFSQRDFAGGPGVNSRLDELHAAILRVKLRGLESSVAKRRQLAAIYDRELPAHIERFQTTPACEHARHLYVVSVADRDGVAVRLAEAGIETGVHYRFPLHQMPGFSQARVPAGGLPHTERHCSRALSVPLHPSLTEADVLSVCKALR
jgi:dTDP-3-amino-2,3,6-trideoxy-4-keto-D-glucose/dTDP-3-amino-3,4,6-trideoxy-alpha-D-glucose/dTDP-2,6-dideoxy-D-kanosamine transaminase